MATVHPSRLGLVPQDSREQERPRYSSRSRPRSPETHPSPGSEKHGGRRSPEYDEYRHPSGPLPWRVEENMYPPRNGRPASGGWSGGNSLSSRQQQRESRTVNIWPPSPKHHVRNLSSERDSNSRKRRRKRERSPSTSSSSNSSSSEEERRRREKKERKRAKKKREKEGMREGKDRSRRPRHSDDEEDRRHSRRSRARSEDRKQPLRSSYDARSASASGDEDQWVEKEVSNGFIPVAATSNVEIAHITSIVDAPDHDAEVGPQPLTISSTSKVDERTYGGSLLRGEGSAMAAFLTDDVNARIPRRGEIGLTSDEIATYESAGYVMSGSRHRRMNAVRMRKENQVISAEEKRGILKLQKEERERREEILREEFKELVDERLKAGGKVK